MEARSLITMLVVGLHRSAQDLISGLLNWTVEA